ncbi:zinc finger protein 574 [Synchiropus picturatus]
METSSVFMCFPCYKEFDTLEEVIKHQLTCTAEEDPSGPVPANYSEPATQQHILNASRTVEVPQVSIGTLEQGASEIQQAEDVNELSADQPRILYQCGDCSELFNSLVLWQQHRKEGTCHQREVAGASVSDPQPQQEPASAQDSTSALVQAKDPDDQEFDISEIARHEPMQSIVEEEQERQEDQEILMTTVAQSPDAPASEVITVNPNADDSSPRRRGAGKKPKPEAVLLCVDCGSCFSFVSELVAHRKNQHGFEEALHRCSVCGECFLNTTLFLYHRKQHRQKGEENMAVVSEKQADNCAEGSTIVEQVQNPTLTNITFVQPELFMCTECGESFSDDARLFTHRREKHNLQEALHTCMHCAESFMNTTLYLYHRRQHNYMSPIEEADGAETVEEMVTTTPHESSKRLLLSPTESGSPSSKRSRPTIRILQGTKASGSKEDSEGNTDPDTKNMPPPAKLMQDWARTPLPHVCPYCGKTFTRRVFLRTHVFSHTGEKLFTCKVCTKSFTNSQSLLRHSMSHRGIKPFTCDVCGKSFSQAAALRRHKHIHMSTEPPRKRGRKPAYRVDSEGAAHLFDCPQCPSRFITEDQLNHHKLLHTSHPFPCSECGEAFKRRKDLDLHSLTHQDKQPVVCPHCASQFVNQSVLDIHLQRCPTTEEERNSGRGRGQGRGRSTGQIECDLCGHRCMTQEGLDLHRLSHTGQTPLKCPMRPCRRRFTSNKSLEEHVLAHFQGTLQKPKARTRFQCQICKKEFAYNSTFKVHMRTHTDERPFECATCGKRFRQLPHLQDHERIHSGARPFCCWICGKSFSVAARLTEHARTHSGEKPYPCPHCSAAFRSRSNLDKHILQHEDLPPESTEEAIQALEAAHVQKVLEGAKVLSSLATTEVDAGTVQTIYVLQEAGGTEAVMIPADQLGAMEGASQVVILPSSVLDSQSITVPTISMEDSEITMVTTSQSPQHSIEFIVEETV